MAQISSNGMDGRGDTLREKANGGPRSPFQEITRLTR